MSGNIDSKRFKNKYQTMAMDYKTYREKLTKIVDKYNEVLFENKDGEKHYWFNKDRVDKDKAFRMLGDILEEFKSNNPELYSTISSNYYQYNCMFIDVAIDDFGCLCDFWGYGIDERLGKCRKMFVFDDVVNNFSKEIIEKMGYKKTSPDTLKIELEKLIAENTKATEGNTRNTTYEMLVESLGYDEGIIQDMEDFGLLDGE